MFYPSPEAEAAAVWRAAVRAGCVVSSSRVTRVGGGRHAVGRVSCPDGWAAARLLVALSLEDAATPGARRLADGLRAVFPTDLAFATAVHRLVKGRVRFQRERGEVFQNGGVTLALGFGDCDDHARLAAAVGAAGGLPVELVFLHRGDGGGPTHALASLAGFWAETTLDAELGEHPFAAALRLRLIDERSDVSKEHVIMTEKDLLPPPEGYLGKNPNVGPDVAALERLGFLCPGAEIADAADPVFREALLAFQLQAGIVADGLIGPQSRRALARALPLDDFGKEYGGIAGIGDANLTSRLSRRFFHAIGATAAALNARGANLKPEAILAVLHAESGLNPAIQNGGGAPYYGLNQSGTTEMRSAGFTGTPQAWMGLSAEDQYTYVDRFFRQRAAAVGESKLTSAAAFYLMNWLPNGTDRAGRRFMDHTGNPDFVIVTSADDPHGWYKHNRAIDVNGDGVIDVADLTRFIAKRQQDGGAFWIEARRRLYDELGQPEETLPPDLSGVVAVLALLGTAAVGVWQVSTG